ncbi:hypothetical protein ROZALSC1DRAFT_30912 [Rozella allomycis CSF55]|uniref:Cilia- and flagella-associated protein 69 ARM repeats domain-containing protein n=1 Tax=Rozella allomycis (strain CSF55) TaxID=988480 RepID=A0A075B0A8_ROZAC|nr:hypothetical protein O9G_001837 [Rozella allomycis CSF55]RKP17260.1 hypothetical protein ROZALSC1DRAFT_30912 [Rozella allomycis CSF55]|eukprot:EPZ34224.1 hypothetical protein O9G_001837 [Rozella allomycis CSF55]
MILNLLCYKNENLIIDLVDNGTINMVINQVDALCKIYDQWKPIHYQYTYNLFTLLCEASQNSISCTGYPKERVIELLLIILGCHLELLDPSQALILCDFAIGLSNITLDLYDKKDPDEHEFYGPGSVPRDVYNLPGYVLDSKFIDILPKSQYFTLENNSKVLMLLSLVLEKDPSKSTQLGSCEMFRHVVKFLGFRGLNENETETVLIPAIDTLWSACMDNEVNGIRFLEFNGMSLLLDAIEDCTFIVQRHACGCLLDLLYSQTAINHVLQWRSRTSLNRNVLHLLTDLWVLSESKTRLNNLAVAKMVLARNASLNVKDFEKDSKVIDELLDDLRIGPLKLMELADAHQKAVLYNISHFFDLKLGEAWLECERELALDGVRPVSPDLKCLDQAKAMINREAAELVEEIESININEQNRNKMEEGSFYATVLERA